ncbi:MerR family transcriptional regulator [Jejudonia soesokkakensis]|uniref:MerR family transcriptional regulator n=1 Tax=Jejudonia soesokkakensis TaxID=1323432 RepID=A0ABW2MWH8_9FLAO
MQVKSQFSIKDLENLTGVKAHTIRIWEKRYNLLHPERTDTNIRKYNNDSLKRILNIAFLYNDGHKISKIAKLKDQEIKSEVKKIALEHSDDYALKMFKSAMLEFNIHLFNETYQVLREKYDFTYIFKNVFIKLLSEIGMLWQTGTIDPIHESFISEAIKQKIIINIDVAQESTSDSDSPTFALFLPRNELHDIGLMYAQYELTRAGLNVIYLGTSIPISDLKNLLEHKQEVVFVTYLTIQPEEVNVKKFIEKITSKIDKNNQPEFWLLGPKTQCIKKNKIPENIFILNDFDEFYQKIEMVKIS